MKRIKKVEKSSALIGKVFDSFETDSHQDAPSIHAIRSTFSNPNLLVNGDFQCNQRNQTVYTQKIGRTYTLDMWAINIGNNTSTVEITDNSIKINPNVIGQTGSLLQVIPGVSLNGKKVTLSFSARASSNVSCYTRVAGDDKGVREEDIKAYEITTEMQRFSFTFTVDIQDANGIIVEPLRFWGSRLSKNIDIYISDVDLYEGNIAFNHIKEDYAIALSRCHQWIKRIYQNCPIMYEYGSTTFSYNFVCAVHDMGEFPNSSFTLEIESWMYYDTTGNTVNGGNNLTVVGISNNRIVLTTPSGSRKSTNCYGVLLSGIISREPL